MSKNTDQFTLRFNRGLKWLIDHYDEQETEKWQQAKNQCEALAAQLDAQLKAPAGYTADEIVLALAWLRGDEESPLIWLDGARKAKLALAEDTGRFKLPVTLRLADGQVLTCRVKVGPEDDPATTWGIHDLLAYFRIRRVFPGAKVVLPNASSPTDARTATSTC